MWRLSPRRQIPAQRIAWVWRQLIRVIVVIVGLWPFFAGMPGPVIATLGPVTLTWTSVVAGLATATRVVGMSLLFFVILFTTRQGELVRGLVQLGLPFEWGLTLAIALRYIPTFTRMVEQIQEAQAARAWRVDRGHLIRRLRGITPVLVALIIGVLRTSDTLGMALAARGVGTGGPRTSRVQLRFSAMDWAALATAVFLSAALLWIGR